MVETIIGLGGLLLGVLGAFITFDAHYRQLRKDTRQKIEEEKQKHAESQVKEYAAQRDFQHLQRNFEQLQVGQNQIYREIELQIKTLALQLSEIQGKVDTMTKVIDRID